MRKFGANWVFTLTGPPLKNGTVTVDDHGTIMGITESGGWPDERGKKEFYDGIIVPGFVNSHCHLELSHLRGRIPAHKGIGHFIGEINRLRNAPEEVIVRAGLRADRDMYHEGIVAVGDISNTLLTLEIKKKSKIYWFTFIETYGFHPARAAGAIEQALALWRRYAALSLPASIVPHSPYSVSDELFSEISLLGNSESNILSLHNQEGEAETLFFNSGKGPVLEHLNINLGIDTSFWHPPGKKSLEYVLPKLPRDKILLLVHNTFTTADDLKVLKDSRSSGNTFMVLCPNSNLYIENRFPPCELFRSENMQICIGTDSLASNNKLSVLSEMITIQHCFPGIPLEELLTWGCKNGSAALGINDTAGTLETGKKPGVVLITSMDIKNLKLTSQSRAIRLA